MHYYESFLIPYCIYMQYDKLSIDMQNPHSATSLLTWLKSIESKRFDKFSSGHIVSPPGMDHYNMANINPFRPIRPHMASMQPLPIMTAIFLVYL